MAADHDPTTDLNEFSQAIAGDILTLDDLADPEWDTYALVAEVSDSSVGMTAYRYTESGPPVPTRSPENSYRFIQLRQQTRGRDGTAWDVVIVKIHRDTASLVMNFVSGEAADLWRVTPTNINRFPEAARPLREDFQLDDLDPYHDLDALDRPEVYGGPQPAGSELPGVPIPVHCNEDVNLVIGDRTNTGQSAAAWPEVSKHRYAAWVGRPVEGAAGLLVRAYDSDQAAGIIRYEAIGLVRITEVIRRADGGYQARVESVPLPGADDVDGVISRDDLKDLLRRAADRDPVFVTGWQRPRMSAPLEVADLPWSSVGDDLLRRLPMPLSARIEAMTRPERERFQTLIDRLREVADGTPPQPETAQRLDRAPTDLPPYAVPVLPANVWLTPGNISTISASAFICEKAFAAGWLAFTADLTVGRAAMLTRPLRRSDSLNADGYYTLTADQIRPAIVGAVVAGEAGRSLVELGPVPSAAEYVREPLELREEFSAYVDLLGRAHTRDIRVTGTASGSAYRLWQAKRFTSLRALMSWQIGQLEFGAQAVLDLQAIAWPDRLRALTHVLRAVADGRPLEGARAEAAGMAAAAVLEKPADDATGLTRAIVDDILALPELRDSEWDTYAVVAEVADDRCAMTAYRYTASGRPLPIDGPDNDDLFWELRDSTRSADGQTWDVVIVKVQRNNPRPSTTFLSGEAADRWRVDPVNIEHLAESLRPSPTTSSHDVRSTIVGVL